MSSNTFNQFLLDNKEKYQGVDREQFNQFYEQAKVHAAKIAEAIGIPLDSIINDTSDIRLQAMIDDGEVLELEGLYWRSDALKDAKAEWLTISDNEAVE